MEKSLPPPHAQRPAVPSYGRQSPALPIQPAITNQIQGLNFMLKDNTLGKGA